MKGIPETGLEKPGCQIMKKGLECQAELGLYPANNGETLNGRKELLA